KTIDWKAYFKALDFTPSAKLGIGTPKFFAALDELRGKLTPEKWQSYFTYHLIQQRAFQLPKAFDDEAFELEKVLSAVEKRQERYKRCIDATTFGLGELLGKQYSDKYFSGAAKQTASMLVEAIFKAMGENIASLDWMSDATKQTALGK